jgi:transcriptional regulator of acetoin/glycerol metabolism
MVIAELEATDRRDSIDGYDVAPREGAGSLRQELARVLAGDVPSRAVRGEIVRSWQESAALGLTPDRFDPPFDRSDEKDSRLLGAATPVIDRLGRDLASTETSVVLAGDCCRIMAREAPSPLEGARLCEIMLSPGYLWGIGQAGTNGLGAAFAGGAPLLVQGDEHFADVLTDVATAGAPIRDPRTAQVLGVLAFVCSAEAANQLLLPMVSRAVREVEQRLLNDSFGLDRLVQTNFLDARRRTRRPLVAVSRATFLTNAAAARLVSAADRPRLWEFASDKPNVTGAIKPQFILADGRGVSVSIEAINDGRELVGALVRFDAGNEAPLARRARSRASSPLHPTFGWDSLTEAERSVMDLVVEGLTNREVAARLFVSPHTVDSHLRHIFRKLDINSRVELVRMVTARSTSHRSLVGTADVA